MPSNRRGPAAPLQAGHPFGAIAQAVPAFETALRRHQAGDLAGARAAYLELVDQPGLTGICLHQLGLLAANRGDHGRAAEMFGQSLRLDPGQPMVARNLSAALDRLGNGAAALGVLVDLGCALQLAGQHPSASSVYREVLARDPLNYAAQVNLGTALAWQEDLSQAARHLVNGLMLYGRVAPEVESFAQTLEVQLSGRLEGFPGTSVLPGGPPHGVLEKIEDALTTLGKVLNGAGFPDEALACYRQSVEQAPEYALGHWNLALALLTEGDYQQGWREYEWRWRWRDFPEPRRFLPVLPWRGQPLDGKRILVWGEQGYGDIIQLAPLVERLAAATGAEVTLEVPTPLVRLMGQSLEGVTVIGRTDNPNAVASDAPLDFALPQFSLPERLGLTRADLPLATAYLRPNSEDLAAWAERLPAGGKTRVGVVWSGRQTQADNAARSIPLDLLRPLFRIDEVSWLSLQLGSGQAELASSGIASVQDLSPHLGDFADTAAAIAQLDLVVSVCTAVVHLAAAMGKPTWLLARIPADWRWGREGSACPWYPSLRIFRQEKAGDWTTVIAEVAEALKKNA